MHSLSYWLFIYDFKKVYGKSKLFWKDLGKEQVVDIMKKSFKSEKEEDLPIGKILFL